jgi:hypothetical protein
VQSRSIPTAAQYSESDESKDGSLVCTCTRETCGCGIHPTGRDEWIASQRVFLARICRALDEALEYEESEAAYGSRSCEQLTLFDLDGSFSKTSQPSVHEAVKLSSPRYAQEAIGTDAGRLLRKTLARRIVGSDGGCWPTPMVGGTSEKTHNQISGRFRAAMKKAFERFPTPRACSGKRSSGMNRTEMYRAMFPTPRNNTGPSMDAKHLSLDGVVKMFPTPTTRDWKSGASNQHGKNSRPLNEVIQRWPTPEASARGQTPKYFKRGNPNLAAVATWTTPSVHGNYNRKGASKESGDGLATQVGGALNPTWVEWLMAFPLGWTACVDWATRKSRSKRR